MFSKELDISAKFVSKRYQKLSNSDQKNEKTVKTSKKSTTLSIYFAIIMSYDPTGASARPDPVPKKCPKRAFHNPTANAGIY
jgi:hypothetical protein